MNDGQAYQLEGGLQAWKRAGLPVIADRKAPLPIMRQVQIVAGSLVLLGIVLAVLVSPWFMALSAFVGAGLIVAGITGFCGMANLLLHMPWNRSREAAATSARHRAMTEMTKEAPAMRPEVTAFFDEATNTISYVVVDPSTKRCAVIDSVLDYDPDAARTDKHSANQIIDFVRRHGLEVEWVLETHVHADHLSAAPYIKQELGGKLAIGSEITTVQNVFGKIFNAGTEFQRDGSQFDVLFKDGDTFRLGEIPARVMHTPGHTPADMTYVIGDAAFVGDTLFMPDAGTARADFPGGDAHKLFRSTRRILHELPDETRLFMCHDYKAPGRDTYAWETTVGEEKRHNIHVREGRAEDEFVAMRTARDKTLGMPRLILPSVQVNMRAGQMPPPEDNGVRYLKIPVDTL